MEVPSGRIVASGLSMPHSPRMIDGQLYVLEGGPRPSVEDRLRERRQAGAGDTAGLYPRPCGLSRRAVRRTVEAPRQARPARLADRGERRRTEGRRCLDRGQLRTPCLASWNSSPGVDEIFDDRCCRISRRGEILAPYQWFEQPSIVTMKGGMWETRVADEDNGAETPTEPKAD